ncbi:MAG: hypothetical protein SGPRY_004493 [Prymnesium sp.]
MCEHKEVEEGPRKGGLAKSSRRGEELTALYAKLALPTQAHVKLLSKKELKAIPPLSDHGYKKNHKELKSKGDMLDYVLKLPATAKLPAGDGTGSSQLARKRTTGSTRIQRQV